MSKKCTCGRYLGMSPQERAQRMWLDDWLGPAPSDQSEQSTVGHTISTQNSRESAEAPGHTISTQTSRESAESLTPEQKKDKLREHATIYNILRIRYGLPGLAYQD